MRFRTKLLLIFLAVALTTNAISLAVMERLSEKYLFNGYQAKLLSIASSVATMVDGDLLAQIQTRDDEKSQTYLQLRDALRRARDANRRPDTYMKRLFAVVRSKADSNVILIAADPEESPQLAAHPGEAYRMESGKTIVVDRPDVGNNLIEDEFGQFLRASAPVKNHDGQVAGAIVVEAAARQVELKMDQVPIAAGLTMLFATLVAIPAALLISRRASRPLQELKWAAERIGKGDFDTAVGIKSRDEFSELGASMNAMAEGLKERDRVKSTFAHYVSQQVVDSILRSGADLRLSGDRRPITVLFCDIRGFSTMSEKMAPEKVVSVLNDYFEAMVEVIFRNNGTLDKFIGDGIMVIFGAPEADPYQEEHALRTAIEMQQEMRKLRAKWQAEGVEIRIGIGINSGPAVVGNIGSSRRMDYTAIGDTVNLASRLETATKELGVEIVVSEYTYNALRGTFQFRPTGSIHVKGRTEAVQTYTPEFAAAAQMD